MIGAASRRRDLVVLLLTALLFAGMIVVLALRPRSGTAWLVAAGAFANLTVAVLLRRARNAR